MAPNEAIAVIGTGFRFPGGANTPSKLWELLKEPRDLLQKVPKERFNVDSFYHPVGSHHGTTNAQHGYMLDENTHAFDASFFGIQPHEADAIDPQHRLLLETVYEGISSAGLKVEELRGSSVAVYVGLMTYDFASIVNHDLEAVPTYAATGTSPCILSNRVSYFFDWRGPSMTLDTACSSSLVAVHLAVQQLRSGSSNVAIAAGANLILGPIPYVIESKLNMLSPTGRSRMWDAAADGYARGEGVAAIVLKTLSQALKDGDNIDCIIRETGVNQDGRSPGITMPRYEAQEALIRETYAKAGLDISSIRDRCQYFEAHGTGTQAGDPQEAEAISNAFFGDKKREQHDHPLYVGSAKTVIGHTEGTAGIAGLLKASLALQHGIIPPNLLFENLNPKIAPFYKDLRILTEAQAWPKIPAGVRRRASVNSFGFGGTNAHIILEAYKDTEQEAIITESFPCIAPIGLSANSERALKKVMEDLLHYLKTEPNARMQDIVWTLLRKRSVLPVRRAINGQTVAAACAALENEMALIDAKETLPVTSDVRRTPNILGIFTGQGAQWPAMGKVLVSTIPYAKEIMLQLDQSLGSLPSEYRPTWTLQEQLMMEGDASNVKDARFAQPLSTAIQILLVELLTSAGVKFKAVVGHSSGEIACAYAAGFITASQAIRISYLRGFVSQLASSSSGKGGAMLAAGCSLDDAQELCSLEMFESRICVAASNSPSSVTLSGDADAIAEAQSILEDESKFARLLNVDKAYHSHHMLPCAAPYIEALRLGGCATADTVSHNSTIWISSVQPGKRMKGQDVNAEYWKENLVSPVLFSEAIEVVMMEHTLVDMGLEVGCHPALKGPCLATIQNCASIDLPYTGCMQRGGNDLDAFTSALGYVWERFGSESLDIETLNAKVSPKKTSSSLAKVLPRYPWDHSRSYWTESRITRAFLQGGEGPPHLLLGKLATYSTSTVLQWSNFIRPREIEWLDGHQLQGQIVFPGAGYVVMAMEGAMHVAGSRDVQLLEVLDLKIDKAVTFDDENSLVELNLTLEIVSESVDASQINLRFRIDSCLAKETSLSSSAGGKLIITFGPGSPHTLPTAQEEPPHANKVNLESFYGDLLSIGYGYSKDFRGLTTLKRADGKACGTLELLKLSDRDRLLIHPATLDVAFQTFIGAYCAPRDKRLRSLLVPTGIGRVALNPWLTKLAINNYSEIPFHSSAASSEGNNISGDIAIFEPEERATLFQIEGIQFKPFSPPSAADDHLLFNKWVWGKLTPLKLLDDERSQATDEERETVATMERIAYFYIKLFLGRLTRDDRLNAAPHHQHQIHWCEYIVGELEQGRRPFYDPSWQLDTYTGIQQLCEKHIYHPFVRLIQRTGEEILGAVRENKNAFDFMDHDGLLSEFYSDPLVMGPTYFYFQELVSNIAHRHQNMNILEIGAGTGGATRFILNSEQLVFNSYTFTDISSSFFDKAREEFAVHEDRMEFRTLDIRRDPIEQGFKPHSYDLIVASNILHATPSLEESLKNARALLKPGGKLVIIEITNREHSRVGLIFGLFPDWWAGVDEGRVLEPYVSMEKWDELMKQTGFSGIESRTSGSSSVYLNSTFCTQAVNDKMFTLLEPLNAPVKDTYQPLVIVGEASSRTESLVTELQQTLPFRRCNIIKRMQDIHKSELVPNTTFVVLSELDDEFFSGLDENKFEALKISLSYAENLLWVTENAWAEHPEQAMSIGLLRSLRHEHADVHIQVLDFECVDKLKIEFLAEQILRLENGSRWQEEGIMWTNEPEIYVSEERGVLVPRLKPDTPRNERLNSSRRPILTEVDLEKFSVAYREINDDRFLECNMDLSPLKSLDSTRIRISVNYSLLKAIRVGDLGYFYLVQGTSPQSGETLISLSTSSASRIEVPASQAISMGISDLGYDALLPVAADLLAQTMLSNTTAGLAILVLSPPEFCIDAIIRRAARTEVVVKFASTRPLPSSHPELWIQLHEKETKKTLEMALPENLSEFYDFSAEQGPVALGQRFAACLPRSVRSYAFEDFFQDLATPVQPGAREILQAYLKEAVAAKTTVSLDIPTVSASELAKLDHAHDVSTVVDWRVEGTLSARIRPVDSVNLFKSNKTYLLVGLAGDLGRSVCRWMVLHGAQHVVLSSRYPKLDRKWIRDMARLGGNVVGLSMNAAQEDSVDAGLAKIRETMPPIGGIAFGPLVLQDILLKNMDLDMMEMVLEPKVKGARILNERFSDPANSLDFFVMFSSFVMVSGNPGQSAYSAANAYTHSIALKRRARGLAGSTIDIGAVYGVGFIARAGREEEFDVDRSMFDSVSEQELHTAFAEAIISGYPDSSDDIEVITGMPPFMDAKDRGSIPFFEDPRFGHFKLPDRHGETSGPTRSAGQVKELLLNATSMDEVRQIVTEGLSEKLRSALQIAADDNINLTNPLIDQGVDSLSAVTIGTWFSKILNLDLPLLKILGGASVADLVEEAATRLPPNAIPLVPSSETASSAEQSSRKVVLSESSPGNPNFETPFTEMSSRAPSDKDEDELESEIQQPKATSFLQENSWKLQKRAADPMVFNSTVAMYMKGHLDLERLSRAFTTSLQRHEIFRTRFYEIDGQPVQGVMKAPRIKFEAVPVGNKAGAEQGFKDVDQRKYDLTTGDTMKIVNFYWSPTEHLLTISYNGMVFDGWSYELLFIEVGKLYDGAELPRPPRYIDYAARERRDYEAGQMDEHIKYWKSLYATLPPVLNVMSLLHAQQRGPVGWNYHSLTVRLNAMIAIRIRERSRKHKATAMQFYLAAYNVLLARLSGSSDISIGVADANRSSIEDLSTMGYFANFLPVRLSYASDQFFGESIIEAKEQMRKALLHSRVPYSVILDCVGATSPSAHAPLFQAVFDYKQGQAESGSIGQTPIDEVLASRAGTPYDITLEMSDDPTKEPLLTFKLQSSLYGKEDVEAVANSYLTILSVFSRNPALRVDEGKLDQGVKTKDTSHV